MSKTMKTGIYKALVAAITPAFLEEVFNAVYDVALDRTTGTDRTITIGKGQIGKLVFPEFQDDDLMMGAVFAALALLCENGRLGQHLNETGTSARKGKGAGYFILELPHAEGEGKGALSAREKEALNDVLGKLQVSAGKDAISILFIAMQVMQATDNVPADLSLQASTQRDLTAKIKKALDNNPKTRNFPAGWSAKRDMVVYAAPADPSPAPNASAGVQASAA